MGAGVGGGRGIEQGDDAFPATELSAGWLVVAKRQEVLDLLVDVQEEIFKAWRLNHVAVVGGFGSRGAIAGIAGLLVNLLYGFFEVR